MPGTSDEDDAAGAGAPVIFPAVIQTPNGPDYEAQMRYLYDQFSGLQLQMKEFDTRTRNEST